MTKNMVGEMEIDLQMLIKMADAMEIEPDDAAEIVTS